MKQAICRLGPKVEIRDVPVPKPGNDEVQIKVIVSGTNPKDWKMAEWGLGERNEGDDIAGIVTEVGEDVVEFRPGDRVAAFHRIRAPHGSYAEYAIAPAHTTFHIPQHTSFEEAATIPLAAMTAAVGLYVRLEMPQPFTPPKSPLPLLIYGASSAVGAYVIKLARKSGIHPLICVAGKSASFVETLIDRSKGDVVIDYREGEGAIIKNVKAALPAGAELKYAFDCISDGASYVACGKALSQHGGKLTMTLRTNHKFENWIEQSDTKVGSVVADPTYSKDDPDDQDFGFAWYRMFALGLKQGWFSAHPYEVVPGGLSGLEQALRNLKDGKSNAVKYVLRIEETPGIVIDSS